MSLIMKADDADERWSEQCSDVAIVGFGDFHRCNHFAGDDTLLLNVSGVSAILRALTATFYWEYEEVRLVDG